jgi:hypothetical protein
LRRDAKMNEEFPEEWADRDIPPAETPDPAPAWTEEYLNTLGMSLWDFL